MVTIAQMLEDEETDDFMSSLRKDVGKTTLKKEIADIYVKGQSAEPRDGLHLSDVIGRSICWRKLVLAHCYKQNPVFHKQWRAAVFGNGTKIHERWQEIIVRSGRALGIEAKHIEMFWQLLFTPDIIMDFRGRPTIVEIKGYNSLEYGRLTHTRVTKTGKTIEPKLPQDAITQCNLYMWFTGIPWGLIVVECKDNQLFEVWELQYDAKLVLPWIPVFDKVNALVEKHLKDLLLIPKLDECASEDMEKPQSCGLREACFANRAKRETMRRDAIWLVQT